MHLLIKKLTLVNFKGIAYQEIELGDEVTTISGRNKAGKTTIYDAYLWLLFGENSQGSKDFSIKTLDQNNVPMREAEHSVEGEVYEDGVLITFKRIFKEKWERKTGSTFAEFTGHKTEYFYNGVPVNQGDYNTKVASIMAADIWKLLSDPFYFNRLKWETRREELFKLAAHITDDDIAMGNPDFESLLANHRKFDLYKRELDGKRTLLSKQKNNIPPRINELEMSNLERLADQEDSTQLIEVISRCTERITQIDQLLSDFNQANKEDQQKALVLSRQIIGLKSKLNTLEFTKKQEYQQKLNDKKSEGLEYTNSISGIKREIQGHQSELISIESEKNSLEKNIASEKENYTRCCKEYDELIAKWEVETAKTFLLSPVTEFNCPTCKQLLAQDNVDAKVEQMEKDFNAEKLRITSALIAKGKQAAQVKETSSAKIIRMEQSLKQLDVTITQQSLTQAQQSLLEAEQAYQNYQQSQETPDPFDEAALYQSEEYIFLSNEISRIESLQSQERKNEETDGLSQERKQLSVEMDEAKRKLNVNENINRNIKRIGELIEEEKMLAQQLADVDREQYIIADFIKTKIETIESTINSKFIGVSFKMFEMLINGTEKPCCETLVNGVPFADANRAGQINAGISIINTFAQHYNSSAPIWVDNAEACNNIMPVASQLILLRVTEDEKLVILWA